MGIPLMEIAVVALCIFLNGFLSWLEMAFVSLEKPKLKKLAEAGNQEAQKILKLRIKPERTLSVLQIGVTLVGSISAAVGGAGAEERLSPIFEQYFHLHEDIAELIALAVVVLPLTYFMVVLGELVPKTLALRNPNAIVLGWGSWLSALDKFLSPLVTLLEKSTTLFLKLTPQRFKKSGDLPHTEDIEAQDALESADQVVKVFGKLEKTKVQDVMVPWSRVTTVDFHQSVEEICKAFLRSQCTRLPVRHQGKVVGVLYSKEFLLTQSSARSEWNMLVRPVAKVSPEATLQEALALFQKKRTSLAMVGSDTSAPLGILTLKDLFRALLGEIHDEDEDGLVQKILSAPNLLQSKSLTGHETKPGA